MRAYADADKIAFSCCFVLAMLTTAAYGRWHYWWRTGFGRARMVLIAAFAGITLEHTVRQWTSLRPGGAPDVILGWIRISAAALATLALAYLLASIVSLNIRRVRDPAFAAARGRRHLERTPWAEEDEIGKLTAFWDEMHGKGRLRAPQRTRLC